MYFVSDDDENVVGVLTEREAEPAITTFDTRKTAAEVMLATNAVPGGDGPRRRRQHAATHGG